MLHLCCLLISISWGTPLTAAFPLPWGLQSLLEQCGAALPHTICLSCFSMDSVLCGVGEDFGSLLSLLELLVSSAPGHPLPLSLSSLLHCTAQRGCKCFFSGLERGREENASGSEPTIQTLAFWHPKKSQGFVLQRRKCWTLKRGYL